MDVDPQAIRSAQQNASLNNLGADKLRLHLVPSKSCPTTFGNGETETHKYDVVIANILYYPLLELADHIVSYAKPGAAVGVSGIISEQVQKSIIMTSNWLTFYRYLLSKSCSSEEPNSPGHVYAL